MNKTTAQIALEAIVNHPHDGYTLADMRAVLAACCDTGVGDFWVDELVELIQRTTTQAEMDAAA